MASPSTSAPLLESSGSRLAAKAGVAVGDSPNVPGVASGPAPPSTGGMGWGFSEPVSPELPLDSESPELLVTSVVVAAAVVGEKTKRVGVGGWGNVPDGIRDGVGSTEGVRSTVGVAVAAVVEEAIVGVTPGALVATAVGVGVWVGVAVDDPGFVGTGVLIVVPPAVLAVRGPKYSYWLGLLTP